jgi:hypothetical protein
MITHYIPQWLLRRFGTRVYELDIHTGVIEPRTIRRAGSGEDLWPEELEKDLMGTHDNDAARVVRYWINGKRRIILPEVQRRTLALWLALFMPRVPNAFRDIARMVQEAREDPQIAVDLLYEKRREALATLRERSPEQYAEIIDILGRYAGEEWMLALVARRIRAGEAHYLPDERAVYCQHLQATRLEAFAEMLCGYHWTWLHSPHGFVIGDNPLLRWHEPSQRWNYGIVRGQVEITMPLSAHLCLLLRRQKISDHGQIMYCPRRQAAEFNRRQRLGAISYVYGGDPALLRPIAAARVRSADPPRTRQVH